MPREVVDSRQRRCVYGERIRRRRASGLNAPRNALRRALRRASSVPWPTGCRDAGKDEKRREKESEMRGTRGRRKEHKQEEEPRERGVRDVVFARKPRRSAGVTFILTRFSSSPPRGKKTIKVVRRKKESEG